MLIVFVGCDKQLGISDDGYRINGFIDCENDALVMVETRTEGLNFVDSTRVKDGKFELEGRLSEPTYLRFSVTDGDDNKYRFGFLAENSDITVRYDVKSKDLTVEGSKSNRKLDSIRVAIGEENESVHRAALRYKDSYEYTYLVYEKLIQDDWKRLDTLISMIDGSLNNSQYVGLIKSEIERARNLEIGGKAPNFTTTDINGKTVSLSDYNGKMLLIDFGASWCPDCIREQEELINLYNRLKDKNLEVLNVACEKNRSSWEKWYDKYKIPYTTTSDLKGWSNEVAILYNVRWLPTYYLIDGDGIIVNKATNIADLCL